VEAQTWRDQRERRYQPARDQARHLIEELRRRLPLVRYQDADVSFVATTYLDTRDGHYLALSDRHDGRRSLKLRIREYLWRDAAGMHHRDTCFLERKERVGEVRLKQRVELAKRDVMRVVLGDRPLRGAGGEAAAIRQELESYRLRPAITTAYERIVFGDDTRLRVTYDERVAFHPPPRGLYNMVPALTPDVLGPPLARGPSRILELKEPSGTPTPDWLEALLAPLAAAPGYSKFRDGMKAMQDADGSPVALTKRLTPLE
jgi:hypothetical protein